MLGGGVLKRWGGGVWLGGRYEDVKGMLRQLWIQAGSPQKGLVLGMKYDTATML